MITLITGALGTGKTALAVKLLTESEFYPSSAFVFGVRQWGGAGTFYDLKAQEFAPDNQKLLEEKGRVSHSCYLVDEAKKVWPSRIAGRPEPGFINAHLAESRSVSQDWILTAQAPTQIDVALRRLVGRHIHLTRTPFGIRYSEAGEIREDLKFSREESRKYDFPKESLKLYKSDEGVTSHQKKGLKVPGRLIFLGLLVVVLVATIAYFWNRSTIFGSSKPGEALAQDGGGFMSTMPKMIGGAGSTGEVLPVTSAPNHYYYKPEHPNYPELAKAPRYPVSCIASAKRCVCFDQAAQQLDIEPARCREIVAGRNDLAILYPAPEPGTFTPSPESRFPAYAPRQADKATAPQGFEPPPAGGDSVTAEQAPSLRPIGAAS